MNALIKEESKINLHDRILKSQPNFQPYNDNGGNSVAIAGDGFCVVASDTRLTTGFKIYTREQSKLFKINDKTILASTGCWCDVLTFNRYLEIRAKMYRYDHNQELSCSAAAQLVSTMLYNRRFFPYYISNLVVGLDENNKGHIYRYDPVGSVEDLNYSCAGSASSLIQPFLDNQVGKKNIENLTAEEKKVNLEEALKITKDAFVSATEREITCGDAIHIFIITKDGIKEEKIALRKD